MGTVVVVLGFAFSAALMLWAACRYEDWKRAQKRKKRRPRPRE